MTLIPTRESLNPMGKPIGTERARELSALRHTFASGSRRDPEKPRCACGKMTQDRAKKRGHRCTTETLPAKVLDPVVEKMVALVIDTVPSPHTKRHYRAALTRFLDWCAFHQGIPFNRTSVHAWKTRLEQEGLSGSSVNLQLSALRKLAREAAANGHLDEKVAHGIEGVANVRMVGHRAGNWLTLEQTQALILAPEPDTLAGKRDRAALALLVGCGLRRNEAAQLTLEHIQPREGRWTIVDMRGKGGRIRTVPVPVWVKTALDQWQEAAGISSGRILRAVNKGDRIDHDSLSGDAILDLAVRYGNQLGMHLKAHDLRRTCAKLCRKAGGELEQIQMLLGHASISTTQRYLGTDQDLVNAPNDRLKLKWRQE